MRSSGRWRSTGFTWRRNITNATARISHRSIWPGEIFSGLNLRGIKMDRALLSGADFTGAHLQAANLAGAIAEQVCFDRADLSRARLSGANLVSASFENACLAKAEMEFALMANAVLQGACLLRVFGRLLGEILLPARSVERLQDHILQCPRHPVRRTLGPALPGARGAGPLRRSHQQTITCLVARAR